MERRDCPRQVAGDRSSTTKEARKDAVCAVWRCRQKKEIGEMGKKKTRSRIYIRKENKERDKSFENRRRRRRTLSLESLSVLVEIPSVLTCITNQQKRVCVVVAAKKKFSLSRPLTSA